MKNSRKTGTFHPNPEGMGFLGSKFCKLIGRVSIGIIVTLMLMITSVIATHFINGVGVAVVKGDSMNPTLEEDTLVLYAKAKGIERFDVVITRDMRHADIIVKRVVGLPGEDVAIIEGILYIDGREYDEPYLHDDRDEYEREIHRTQLSDNEYYVLGDNRDNSTDSRFIGPVGQDDIIGRVHRTFQRAGGVE